MCNKISLEISVTKKISWKIICKNFFYKLKWTPEWNQLFIYRLTRRWQVTLLTSCTGQCILRTVSGNYIAAVSAQAQVFVYLCVHMCCRMLNGWLTFWHVQHARTAFKRKCASKTQQKGVDAETVINGSKGNMHAHTFLHIKHILHYIYTYIHLYIWLYMSVNNL